MGDAMTRRWTEGERIEIGGIVMRVRHGDKFPGDLVLEQWNGRQWCRVKMAHALALIDFLTENERERRNFMSFWKENGDTFFLKHVVSAVRDGWRPVAESIERQRGRDVA